MPLALSKSRDHLSSEKMSAQEGREDGPLINIVIEEEEVMQEIPHANIVGT